VAATPPHLNESVVKKNIANFRPESTRSLANLNLKPGHEKFGMTTSRDLRWVSGFKK